jgi:hypothetical protein
VKTITLRNLPPDLERALEREARTSGSSLAATVIRHLRLAMGLDRTGRATRYDDLDGLAGTWSDQEADAFARVLAEQRAIDSELWTRDGG